MMDQFATILFFIHKSVNRQEADPKKIDWIKSESSGDVNCTEAQINVN